MILNYWYTQTLPVKRRHNVCHGVLMYRLILKMFEINSYINILTKIVIVKILLTIKYLFWYIYKITVNVHNV